MASKGILQRAVSPRELATWLIPPASGWQRKLGRGSWGALYRPAMGLMGSVIGLALFATLMLFLPQYQLPLKYSLFTLALSTAVFAFRIIYLIRRDLLTPLGHVRNWSMRMRGGNLGARIPIPAKGEFQELAHDINQLGVELQLLSKDMNAQVRKQTDRIEQKTRSLQILYDVAASINASRDLDDLLSRFLGILTEVTGARAGTVRLLAEDNQMYLVSSVGIETQDLIGEFVVPLNRCQCGKALTRGEVITGRDVNECSRFNSAPLFNDDGIELIAVPLEYQGKQLGVYNLFVDQHGLLELEDLQELLSSIGKHLGMAIEKTRLDQEAKQITILEERNQLAHEIHDSLAQTLASLRFQVRTLEKAAKQKAPELETELARLREGIYEGNREVRELISHFRAPMDKRGLKYALQKAINDLKQDKNISVFVQEQWKYVEQPEVHEHQIVRIVQEAFCNARKHSEARTIRLLLKGNPHDGFEVLIEDDGVGITRELGNSGPGDHIGLTVMQERAKRIGGNLTIESEAGEGTRILLRFPHNAEKALPEPEVRSLFQ